MRFIKFIAFLFFSLTWLGALSAQRKALAAPSNSKADRMLNNDLELMTTWFEGEFNNFQQVWQEEQDSVEAALRHEHIHSIFTSVVMPKIGTHVFYVKQYIDDDPEKIYRQRIYRFKTNSKERAIQLDIFSFMDEKAEKKYKNANIDPQILTSLTEEQLKNTEGCEVFWKKAGDHFVGYMKEKACQFVSDRSGKRIFITDSLRLSQDEIWIRDEAHDEVGDYVFGNKAGIHHKLKRCRQFSGWMAVQKPDSEEYTLMRDILIHDQGQRVPLVDREGTPTKYSVELAEVIYKDGQEVLKLSVYNDDPKKPMIYTWTNPESVQIGINMQSITTGFKLVE
ncbi:MAG: chromophore lyase CpcT/CpeT [Bacteroidota bacterium]